MQLHVLLDFLPTKLGQQRYRLCLSAASGKLSEAMPPPQESERALPPPGKLDLVLAHYSHFSMEKTTEWWSGFLDIQMVRSLL